MKPLIYLDYNATAPLHDTARATMIDALALGNPSSIHTDGRLARSVVEKARAAIAKACRTKPANIIFTSGATEANALALHGLTHQRTLVSAIEHDAVLANAKNANILPVLSTALLIWTLWNTYCRIAKRRHWLR